MSILDECKKYFHTKCGCGETLTAMHIKFEDKTHAVVTYSCPKCRKGIWQKVSV